MPPREGETDEEYRERKKREKAEKPKDETDDERRARKEREKERGERPKREETDEERKIRKEREKAAAASETAESGGTRKESDEERHARKERERAERHARRAAEEANNAAATATATATATSNDNNNNAEESSDNNNRKSRRPDETDDQRRERKERKERERREKEAAAQQEPAQQPEEQPKQQNQKDSDTKQRSTREREAAVQEKESAGDPDPENQQQQQQSRSKRAKETDEERNARKDREKAEKKERERKEREAAENPNANSKKPGTPQTVRERLEARAKKGRNGEDEPPSPSAGKGGNKNNNNNKDDEGDDQGYDQGYEDDFEDVYDADELSAAQRAMEKENAAIKNAAKQKAAAAAAIPSSAAFVEMEGVARAGFDRKSLEEQKAKAQFEKDFQRASALRRVVDLEEVRFPTVADIAPLSQYDMFVRGVGGVARNTVGENMPERSSIEIQAERVVMKSKGCSVPVDLGLDPETATSSSSAMNNNNNNNNASKGTGGGGVADDAVAALARRSVDTASLSKFLNKAGGVILSLLDEENEFKERKARGAGAGGANSKQQQQSSLISFATQTSTFSAPFLANRPVTRVAVSPSTSQYFLVVHGNQQSQQQQQPSSSSSISGNSVFAGLVTIWNVHNQQQCEKVLAAFSEIRDACFSRTRPYLIYGGTASGAVCVWDLREPAHAHGGHGIGAGSTAFRLPSFTTDSTQYLNHAAPVQRVVSCGSSDHGSSSSGGSGGGGGGSGSSSSHDEVDSGSVEQITSVDRTGCLSFWVLNESEQSNEIIAVSSSSATTTNSSSSEKNNSNMKDHGAAALESLISASMSTASCVRLHRMGTGNTLDTSRGMKSSSSKNATTTFTTSDSSNTTTTNADGVSSSGKKESSGIVATITDMEQSSSDATRLVVSAYTGVAHVSRFGSIAAPISYGPTRLVAGPGIAPSAVIGAGMTAASTCVASCRADSRLLLVGYADGTIRLYLRVDTAPKLTVLSTEHQSIVSVCFAPNTKWLAFALDAGGNLFALDFAVPGSRNKPFAHCKVVKNGGADVATSVTTFVDERPETRLLVGFKSGAAEIYTFMDSVLAPAVKRDMYWL